MNQIITGEKLQYLADLCLIDTYNPNYKKYSKNFFIIKKNKKIILPTIKIIDFIKKNISIYLPTHLLSYFYEYIYPHINKCIIITHNSDHGLIDKFPEDIKNKIIESLNNDKIIKWFSQNTFYQHKKIITLPIGLANSMWPHGNLNLFSEIMNKNIKKDNLCYFNFNINTNKLIRKKIYDICIINKFKYNSFTNYKKYLINLKKSKFCICPPGNGYDCHRLWEALYLNTIPIVSDIPAYNQYKNLPILFIKDWKIINNTFLKKKYEEFKNKKYNLEKIYLKYYELLIKNYSRFLS